MNPARYSEGELIFLRALGALGDDDAARSGDDDDNRPHEEATTMAGMKVSLSIEHDGTRVTIDQPNGDQGGVEMHGAEPVALDFGKWARIAACIASCVMGAGASQPARENVAAGHDVKSTNQKPQK